MDAGCECAKSGEGSPEENWATEVDVLLWGED